MFTSLGLFKDIPCPRQQDCRLPTCIFSHFPSTFLAGAQDAQGSAQEYDPLSAGEYSAPPAKRRRLESPQPDERIEDVANLHPVVHKPDDATSLKHKPSLQTLSAVLSTRDVLPRTPPPPVKGPPPTKAAPASTVRTVSPPPTKDSKAPIQQSVRKALKVEPLTPRTVAKAPAVLKTRLAVLQKLHEQMQVQNKIVAALDDHRKPLVLTGQELIAFALDEEENATKLGEHIYKNAIAQRILRIKKMTTEEWLKIVGEWTGAASGIAATQKIDKTTADRLPSDLSSLSAQTALLRHLLVPLEGLEKYGYVTSQPTCREIASAMGALAAAAGFETCDRCGTRFQVFPGRDEDGRLTSHGKCRYHWGRANRQARSKADKILGESEASYSCCNKSEGSEGCSEAASHVFYVKDVKRLASILQFEHTPAKPDIRGRQPVSFDCEMGYTTLGMEVIRVTAVSWPEAKPLLDVLVRPYGEILDLNTRFSGVTGEAFADAPSYEQVSSGQDLPYTGAQLSRVGSPAVARLLLFDLLSPDTPLIGHAIENDLNVCRIIHPFVIDTVLLYPHPRGLPFKYGLRMLSQRYLSRSIQAGGAAGHDSKEDAIATGDLVTKKVVEKWSIMKHEGWRFVDGLLTAPEERAAGMVGSTTFTV